MSDFLQRYDISLQKGKDQYFLHNELVIDRMISEADVSGDDTVLEIGAGIGSITRRLAEQAGTVIAFENDETMLPPLRDHISEFDNVEIVERDIMHAPIPEFDKCVSNIPFHLSSDILELLGEQQKLSVLLVQDAFARKLIAEPGDDRYTRISVETQYSFTPVYLDSVYDINFTPSPPTNAAMIKLFPSRDKYDVDDEPFFQHALLALFNHSGKKLRNAFYDSRHMFDLTKDDAREIQDDLPYADERVVTLDVKQLIDVTNMLHDLLK